MTSYDDTVALEIPKRLEVLALEDYESHEGPRVHSTKVGVLLLNKNRNGFNLVLDFLPLKPGARLIAVPPRPRD